jgi:hypothetical protein
MYSSKNVGPDDSFQYNSYSIEDLNAMPDDQWIIFMEDMSTGPFDSEADAREANDLYLEWEDVEYITIAEFKQRVSANFDLEFEPFD